MSFIAEDEAKYIANILSSGAAPSATENALEQLCSLYRKGACLKDVRPVKNALAGLLNLSTEYPKVIRWTLNAITQVCKRRGSDFIDPVCSTLERFSNDNEIMCAGVTALFAIEPNETKILGKLHKLGIPLDGPLVVAASPYSEHCRKSVETTRINISTAAPLVLQHAALLIGTNKAPEHFFEPRHTNKVIIGKLNIHPSALVAQYSVWAISENSELGIADLGLDIRDVFSAPENVRRWLYQLLTKDSTSAESYRELIEQGSKDVSRNVREGLARGLRHIYFAGIETIIMEWYGHETDDEIKFFLNDHMAANADKSSEYAEAALTTYNTASPDSTARLRLQIAASKTQLFPRLMQLKHTEERSSPLFGLDTVTDEKGGLIMVNQTVHNHGNIGAISAVGDNTVEDFVASTVNNEALGKILLKLVSEIKGSSLTPNQRDEVHNLIKAAASHPSRSKLKAILDWAEKIHLFVWLKAEVAAFFVGAGATLPH